MRKNNQSWANISGHVGRENRRGPFYATHMYLLQYLSGMQAGRQRQQSAEVVPRGELKNRGIRGKIASGGCYRQLVARPTAAPPSDSRIYHIVSTHGPSAVSHVCSACCTWAFSMCRKDFPIRTYRTGPPESVGGFTVHRKALCGTGRRWWNICPCHLLSMRCMESWCECVCGW